MHVNKVYGSAQRQIKNIVFVFTCVKTHICWSQHHSVRQIAYGFEIIHCKGFEPVMHISLCLHAKAMAHSHSTTQLHPCYAWVDNPRACVFEACTSSAVGVSTIGSPDTMVFSFLGIELKPASPTSRSPLLVIPALLSPRSCFWLPLLACAWAWLWCPCG